MFESSIVGFVSDIGDDGSSKSIISPCQLVAVKSLLIAAEISVICPFSLPNSVSTGVALTSPIAGCSEVLSSTVMSLNTLISPLGS